MEEKLFEEVLLKDEKIIKIFKPKKDKFYFDYFIPNWVLLIPLIWPHIIIFGILPIFPIIVYFIARKKAYNNTYYAYTNKRIIIRTGAFGLSYNILEYKDITSSTVVVGYFDKKFSTGSVEFRSPSIHHGTKPIVLEAIEHPYEAYKDIKEYIDCIK